MKTMFTKQDLQNLGLPDFVYDKNLDKSGNIYSDKIISETNKYFIHEIIFSLPNQEENKAWKLTYNQSKNGADNFVINDSVSVYSVRLVEKIIRVWEPTL